MTKAKEFTSLSEMCERIEFSERIIENAINNCDTPDLPYLNQFDGHPIFVYGTLKTGFPRDYVLKHGGARFVSSACTFEQMALYYQRAPGADRFPVMFQHMSQKVINQGAVLGQMWVVPTKLMCRLDNIEQNGKMFRREPIKVQLMSKPYHHRYQMYEITPAWCYLGVKTAGWIQLIDDGHLGQVVPQTQPGSTRPFLNFSHEHAGIEEGYEI